MGKQVLLFFVGVLIVFVVSFAVKKVMSVEEKWEDCIRHHQWKEIKATRWEGRQKCEPYRPFWR